MLGPWALLKEVTLTLLESLIRKEVTPSNLEHISK